MIIRREEESDIDVITEVVKSAFEDHSFSCHTEHFTISDLRDEGGLAISLVAEVDGQIAGHIPFSPVTISDSTCDLYALGPVSVLPEYQGGRIGTALIEEGISMLKSMGARGCTVLGLPSYFQRFGFRNNSQLVLEDVPGEVFVTSSFDNHFPAGIVEYHRAFRQLSLIEQDAISDVIVDYDLKGVRINPSDPGFDSLIEKDILTKMPDGRYTVRPFQLAEYNKYFGKVSQFMITEMSRVHKNPLLSAIKYGTDS